MGGAPDGKAKISPGHPTLTVRWCQSVSFFRRNTFAHLGLPGEVACLRFLDKTIHVNPSWGVSFASTNEHFGAILRPFPILYSMGQCKAPLKEGKLDRT